jgi:Low affinity iron permease/Enoyl-CoA hydratase/isomerase
LGVRPALERGLVNRVVPAHGLDAAVDEFVAAISRSRPLTVGIGKEAFDEQAELDEPRAYDLTESVMAMSSRAADVQEGICAFLDKRPPGWASSCPRRPSRGRLGRRRSRAGGSVGHAASSGRSRSVFGRFAEASSRFVSTGGFFGISVLLVLLWLPTIFVLPSVDTWQLVLNTIVSVLAFLLVALLQNSEHGTWRETLGRGLDVV